MTNLAKTVDKKSEVIIQNAQSQMETWREELNELEAKLSELSAEAQTEYDKLLAKLKLHWQQVESKFSVLQQSNDAQQETAYADWRDTAVSYNKTFTEATNSMKEFVPLGWLQGFTSKRTLNSQGWAEGFGKRPAGSEGFAEGMGHKDNVTSKGWAEGYDKISQS